MKQFKRKMKRLGLAVSSIALSAIMCSAAGCKLFFPDSSNPESSSGTPDSSVVDPGDDPVVQKYLEETTVDPITGKTVWESANGIFHPDYDSQTELRLAGKNLNIKLAEEGMVLMKNANALPLTEKETNVSLFGYRSYNIMPGGGGSGAGRQGVYGIPMATLVSSLYDAGFNVNPSLLNVYGSKPTAEVPIDELTAVSGSYAKYDDAAIVTIARGGSEGTDIARHDVAGNEDTNKHNLELTDGEIELIKYVKGKFDKVIVLINSANCLELGELDAAKTKENLGVDAILWVGQTGNDGATAIGRILNGSVNPSGHLVDTWERDFTKGPTFTNIGDLSQNFNEDGTRMNNNLYVNGEIATGGEEKATYHSVEYREGIYMGYKYYETMADDMNAAKAGSGDTWFKESVVYPFGYGLSYTSFEWEMAEDIAPTGKIEKANSTVTMKVKVTNTGKVAGKDVVQVYVNPPYTKGGIEKASANLMGFAKTKMLAPGESEVVTVQFVAQDFASFDYNDANNNNFVGYELEKGDYEISVRMNSHDEVFNVVRTIENDIQCKTDYQTGNEITTQFTGAEGLEMYKTTNDALEANQISRTDLKQPAASTIADRTVSQAYIDGLNAGREYFSYQDTETDPWYVSQLPSSWDQAGAVRLDENEVCEMTLKDMMGVSYIEPTIENGVVKLATDADSQKWEKFMNQLTWSELVYLICAGDYGQGIAIPAIEKELVFGGDGPTQFAWNSSLFFGSKGVVQDEVIGTSWVIAPVIASTWNRELESDRGVIVGNESLFANVNEWYGPGLNIHRSPFSGRNFEYYSEDGVLSGKMCAELMKSMTAKGIMCRIKHMFLNDQETNRNTSGGVLTWCNEQAIREIYLKAFEITVKEGHATGGMTSFNRIGDAVCSTNYALLENIFRGEWNFRGTFVTDCQDYAEYRYLNIMARTGQELPLGQSINMYKGNKIFEARFGIGYASAVEGTWDPEAKCVRVATNYEDAMACESLRKNCGDMYYIYTDADVLAGTSAKETELSPTHYFAVRKSAQRVLYDYVNSNNMKNAYNKTIGDLTITAEATTGRNNNINVSLQSLLDLEAIGTSKIDIASVSGLPAGVTVDGLGNISGKVAEAGTYTAKIQILLDGWVRTYINVNFVITEAAAA